MAAYRLSPNARDDLERIWFYGLGHHGPAEADRYLHTLFERFSEIAEQPLLYAAVDDIRAGYRRSVCGKESIYYRIATDAVEIMAIISRQSTGDWL